MSNKSFKKFLILWIGELISAVGGGLTSFGLGVYIFQQTGSAGQMALVTLMGFLPTLILGVPAGALADRMDRRMLMMLGDGLSAIGIMMILFFMLTGGASLNIILIGVFISAVFSSLLEPAYKATVTDLLTSDEYARANGMVSLAGSARYLVSPILAGMLLSFWDVSLLLIIDICTFAVTLATTFIVKKGIATKKIENREGLMDSIVSGYNALRDRRGVFNLVLVMALLTLFVGIFQVLAEPIVLSFSDPGTLGIIETICASGMLVSGLYLGIRGMKGHYVQILSISLAIAGVCIVLFSIWESTWLISVFGFGFFLMLPFANSSLDYLIRSNIPDELQGRAWGLIGLISQIGYIIAYGLCGALADRIADVMHITVGRGAAIEIGISGIALLILAALPSMMGSIRKLESGDKT